MYSVKNLFGIQINVCEFECDESYDSGEYLDYENGRCRKKLVDKLAEECTKTVEGGRLAKINLVQDEGRRICLAQRTLCYFQ